MSVEHPNKILAHDPLPPYPKVFAGVFWALCLYLVIVFGYTGSHYVVHPHDSNTVQTEVHP